MEHKREVKFWYYDVGDERKVYLLHEGIIELLEKLEIDSVGVISDMPY